MTTYKFALAAVGAITSVPLLVACSGSAQPAATVTVTAAPGSTATAPAATTAPEPAADGGQMTTFGEGIYTVGLDIKPGTYRVTAAVSDCYWAILKTGTNGDDIIQSDVAKGGYPTVTVRAGKVSKTSRGGTWTIR